MDESKNKSEVGNDRYYAYEIGMKTDQDIHNNSEEVQLVDDGNVTRQMLNAIGFETLQTYDPSEHANE